MNRILAIAILASLVLMPMQAAAQQSEDFGKSAVAQALMKSKKQEAPARTVEAPKPASPYALREDVPENVDDLMERVEQQNSALVDEFEKLIEKDPLNPDAPKWLGEIAEFHWQMAHYAYLRARRAWIAQLDTCADTPDTCPPEPQADYRQSIDDYRRILAKYPAYERMDDVLFRLGDALIRNGQSKEGISYLHRLTQNYPDYKELDAAYLAMGEFYFSQKNTGTAQAAYQTIVDKYPDSTYFQYAQYKLAWTYLNLADEESYEMAIALFKQVVESIDSKYAQAVDADGQIDENKLNAGVISFRNQALNDLSTTYVELEDGWKQARAYLRTKLPAEKARDKIEQLGGILDAQGKFEEEIELYGDLMQEEPKYAHVVDWRIARIEALKAANRLDEAEAETRTAIAMLNPESDWYKANAGDAGAVRRSTQFVSMQLNTLALNAIEKAEKTKNAEERDALWADAEKLLSQQIAWYAKDESFDIYYTYAYVLDERSDGALSGLKKQYGKRLKSEPELASDVLKKLQEAAAAYQRIVDWKIDTQDEERAEQVRVAANRQVFVYANILATSDPDWSIVNSAKATNFVEEKRGSSIQTEEPLTEHELGFVRSAEQFSSRYPKDDETPAFLWRAAEIYRTRYHYNQAASRFDEIVTNFPDHQYAAVAVGSMFELYNKAGNYEKIEYWAKWLIEHKNFKHYSAKELEDTASFAIDKQAVALAEAGNIDDATTTIMRIVVSFPDRRELKTAAMLKAGAFEASRKRYMAAISFIGNLQFTADTQENRAHAAFLHGIYATKAYRYAESAHAFERAQIEYFAILEKLMPKKDDVEDAKTAKSSKKKAAKKPETVATVDPQMALETLQSVYYGAQLFKAIGKTDLAIAMLMEYAYKFPKLELYQVGDDMKSVLTEEEKANAIPLLSETIATLEAAAIKAEKSPAAGYEALEEYAAGMPKDKELTALDRQVYFQWAQYAADAHELDATKKALSNLKPDESTWSKAEMARMTYLQGRAAQLEFEDVELEFPIRTLRKRIEQKAKLRQTAEKYFQQAITYKNAQISTASAYELANMALHFRDAFKELPPPKELENDPDGLEEYTIWIEDELIFPAEDAAASLLDVGRQITVQLESYTPQAYKTAQSLAELKPDIYPVAQSSVDIEQFIQNNGKASSHDASNPDDQPSNNN